LLYQGIKFSSMVEFVKLARREENKGEVRLHFYDANAMFQGDLP